MQSSGSLREEESRLFFYSLTIHYKVDDYYILRLLRYLAPLCPRKKHNSD